MDKHTLYGIDKKGGVKEWSVWTEDDTIFVTHGKLGGKIQTKTTICKGKNLGRSNETSPSQQASSEALSKYNKQKDKFYKETIEEATIATTEGVMLASDYLKQSHRIEDYFYASAKLDGLRCKSVLDGEVLTLQSRGGKTYPIPPHLAEPLLSLHKESGLTQLDGELYIHGLPLQKIVSAAKKHNENTHLLEYHIFDIPLEGVVWEDRITTLTSLEGLTSYDECPKIKIVDNIFTNKDTLEKLQSQYRSEGYEGVMLRNPQGLYEFQNKRSADLQKYKLFYDSEALVVGCEEDKNKEGVLSCLWTNPQGKEVSFSCKMKGTHEFRDFNVQKGLIGEWINFTYQDTSVDGVPTFPVGVVVREMKNGTPVY